MKIHPIVGAEILERVAFPYPVAPIVRCPPREMERGGLSGRAQGRRDSHRRAHPRGGRLPGRAGLRPPVPKGPAARPGHGADRSRVGRRLRSQGGPDARAAIPRPGAHGHRKPGRRPQRRAGCSPGRGAGPRSGRRIRDRVHAPRQSPTTSFHPLPPPVTRLTRCSN